MSLFFDFTVDSENYKLSDQTEAVENAKAGGLVVFNFTPAYGHIITLDLDSKYPPTQYAFMTTSKSGNKHGFVPTFCFVNDVCHVAKVLGSDTRREDISDKRFKMGDPLAYLLFETKDEAAKLRAWLKTLPRQYRGVVEL